MSSEYPEAVTLAAEGLHGGALAHVPHADGLVFADGKDQFVFWVEKSSRDAIKQAKSASAATYLDI